MRELRFFITDDLNVQGTQVYPLGKKSFAWELEDDQQFYRLKQKVDYIFTNRKGRLEEKEPNKVTDYSFLIAIENDSVERCRIRYVVVQQYCEGVWSDFHVGKFTMNDATFDLDKCKIDLDVHTVDEYTCILESQDEEFNMLETAPILTTKTPRELPYEFLVCPEDCAGACTGGDLTWALFYEDCTAYLPGTGVANNETNTNYGVAAGQPEPMRYGGADWYFFFDSKNTIAKYQISTQTVTQITLPTPTVSEKYIGLEGTIAGYANVSGGSLTVYKRDMVTGPITSWVYPFSTLDFLDVGNGQVISVIAGLPSTYTLRRDAVIIHSDTSPITQVSVSDAGIIYYRQQSGELRLFRFSDNSDNLLVGGLTIGTVQETQINSTYAFYRETTNNVFNKVEIATLTNTNINTVTNVSAFKISDSYTLFEDASVNELTLHELSTGIETVIITSASLGIFGLNDFHVGFMDGANFKHYDIATPGIVIVAADTVLDICVDGNNLMYRTDTIFKDYETQTATIAFTKTQSAAGQKTMDCGNNTLGFIEDTTTDKYWFYTPAVDNEDKVKIFYREVRTTVCLGGTPTPPSGGGWVLVSDDCATLGIATWKRVPTTPPNQIGSVIEGGCLCTPVCSPIRPVGGENYILIGGCGAPGDLSYWLDPLPDIEYTRGRLLYDVLVELISRICPEITTIKSDFFQWNPDILTDTNYVTGLENELMHLSLHQKSDVRTPNSSEPASKGVLTFAKIAKWFSDMFNVWWYMENETTLRFEHVSVIGTALGLDLTQEPYLSKVEHQRTYEYDKSELPKIEKFQFMEQENVDNTGFDIEYKDSNGDWSLCAGDSDTTIAPDSLTTDLILIQQNPSDVSRSGFVMMANDYNGVEYQVRVSVGAFTGQNVINGALGWANLHENYLKWERALEEGVMNRQFTSFNTKKRVKKQKGFKITLCCEEEFNPVNLVKTNLGTGKIEEAEIDFKTRKLELKIKY